MNSSVLKISRYRAFARLPTRGTSKSAGIDLYIPEINEQMDIFDYNKFIRDFDYHNGYDNRNLARLDLHTKEIILYPHGKVYIPIGIRIKVPEGSALIAFNKSGVSFKQSVARLSCVIDEDYQGEIGVTLQNYSNETVTLQLGQKITQLVRVPVYYDSIEEVNDEDLFSQISERGEGKMGSTGIN